MNSRIVAGADDLPPSYRSVVSPTAIPCETENQIATDLKCSAQQDGPTPSYEDDPSPSYGDELPPYLVRTQATAPLNENVNAMADPIRSRSFHDTSDQTSFIESPQQTFRLVPTAPPLTTLSGVVAAQVNASPFNLAQPTCMRARSRFRSCTTNNFASLSPVVFLGTRKHTTSPAVVTSCFRSHCAECQLRWR